MEEEEREPCVRRWLRPVVIVLIILGCGLRFVGLDRLVLRDDEGQTGIFISGTSPDEVRERLFDGTIHSRAGVLEYQFPRAGTSWIDTVRVLATADPKQGPVYYVTAREWVIAFGASVFALRSYSAVLGVLALPLVWLLARELFEDRLVAWAGVGLIAVAPLHLVYNRDARPYPLWVVCILLTSWLLLVAVRRAREGNAPEPWTFAAYGAACVLALYSHLLSLQVMIAHVVFVVGLDRFRWTRTVRATIGTVVAAGVVYLPLGRRVVEQLLGPRHWLDWIAAPVAPIVWLHGTGLALVRVFFDVGGPGVPRHAHLAGLVLLACAGMAVLLVIRTAPRRARLFLLTMAVVSTGPFLAGDLLGGGWRMWRLKYQFPAVIAVELSVAYWVVWLASGTGRRRRAAAAFAGIAFALAGALSGLCISRAEWWWHNKGGGRIGPVARWVNPEDSPLVVAGYLDPMMVHRVLSVIHLLDDDVRLLLVDEPPWPAVPIDREPVYAYHVSDALLRWLGDQGWQLQPLHGAPLYRLTRRPTGDSRRTGAAS